MYLYGHVNFVFLINPAPQVHSGKVFEISNLGYGHWPPLLRFLRILRLPMTIEEIEVVFRYVDKKQRGSATISEFEEAIRAATISASTALEKNGTYIPFSTRPAHFWRHEHRSALGPNPNHERRPARDPPS